MSSRIDLSTIRPQVLSPPLSNAPANARDPVKRPCKLVHASTYLIKTFDITFLWRRIPWLKYCQHSSHGIKYFLSVDAEANGQHQPNRVEVITKRSCWNLQWIETIEVGPSLAIEAGCSFSGNGIMVEEPLYCTTHFFLLWLNFYLPLCISVVPCVLCRNI